MKPYSNASAMILRETENCRLPGSYSDSGFFSLFSENAQSPVRMLLRSGGDIDAARYSIAAWEPLSVIEAKDRLVCISYENGNRRLIRDCSPIDSLDAFIASITCKESAGEEPFHTGVLGYCSYDIKNDIETLPQTAVDDLSLPDLFFFVPANVLIHDRVTGCVQKRVFVAASVPDSISSETMPVWSHAFTRSGNALEASGMQMEKGTYIRAVNRIKEYIRDGDVYQVNFAHRIAFPQPRDPLAFWDALYANNPAPYYAYIETPSHSVLCTSMEKCITKRGNSIVSQPIKGTRKRGATAGQDAGLIRELRTDSKEDAELSMIVDLVRNDIGKVSVTRSVQVMEHKRLDSYTNVHHLSSVIRGELQPGAGLKEMLRALLPAGSITGCPKIRAMEIIDELEPVVRHIYTGAIGYIDIRGDLDLNVAIRTALCTGGVLYFSVGGGIVCDSIPEHEFSETLHKGETMLSLLKATEWIL